MTEATAGKNTRLYMVETHTTDGQCHKSTAHFPLWALKETVPPTGQKRQELFFYCPEVRATMTSYIILVVKGSTHASNLLYTPLCCIQPCFSKGIFNADLIISLKSPSNSTRLVFIFCIIQVYNKVYNTLRAQITPVHVCSTSKVIIKQIPSCRN